VPLALGEFENKAAERIISYRIHSKRSYCLSLASDWEGFSR